MELNCPECGSRLGNKIDNLASHLRYVHAIPLSGVQKFGFKCGQSGCVRSFYKFSSLRRHIRLRHHTLCIRKSTVNNQPALINSPAVQDVPEDDARDADCDEYACQSEESEIPINFKESVSAAAVKMVAELRANSSFTGAGLKRAIWAAESLLCDYSNLLKLEFKKFVISKDISVEDTDFQELISKMESPEIFQSMQTIDGQILALKKKYKFVDPVEIPLGYRVDMVRNRLSKDWEPKQVLESFQYVPITETLKMIVSHKAIRDYIKNETSSPAGILGNFRDGNNFKSSPYFRKYPQALRIQLYYDDIVVNNPLGSKVHAHKLGAFYFSIQNLPPHLNSLQSSIHVLAICLSADIDKYGINKILMPFVEEMKKLESDAGVLCSFEGEIYILRAALAAVCADTLAAHLLFGLKGPGANSLCRNCMIQRHELLDGALGPFETRTRDLHNRHLNMIRNNNEAMKIVTGVREDTILHQLHFHFSENWAFDFLHDILEGVGEMSLYLVLKHMITQRNYRLTVALLNSRIHLFNYGSPDIKNKPSANFTPLHFQKDGHSLPQKGAQIWLLLRVFPFLVSDMVADEDEYIELIILMNRINEIIFAHKVYPSIVAYLHELIKEFQSLFRKLFPHVNIINKMHHLMHYAKCLLESGPLRLLSCMRYEMRHIPLKNYGSKCCNFRNLPKTTINMCQVSQSAWWGTGRLPVQKIHCTTGRNTDVENCRSTDFLLRMGLSLDSTVFVSDCVKVWGTQYRSKLFVALDSGVDLDNDDPVFGRIREIVIVGNESVYLNCDEWEVSGLDPMLNAYSVLPTVRTRFVNVDSLCDQKPLSLWNSFKDNYMYICLRHVLP